MSPTARVVVCGLGPGGHGDVTEATRALLASTPHCFLRTRRHPSADLAPGASTFDHIYDRADRLDEVYRDIADALIDAAERSDGEPVVYAVPGSPLVLERSVRHLRDDPRIEVELLPAVSFLDTAWARLGIDPVEASVRLIDGHVFAGAAAGERGPLLVAHTHARWVLSDIKLAIDAGSEQKAIVLQRLGTPDESIVEVAWPDLDRVVEPDHLTSIYLPEVTAPVAQELQAAVDLVRRLRQGCPWDREQTHASLRPFLLEESYEVLEVLDRIDGDDDAYVDLEEELGDLLFQVLLHAELAGEVGEFSIADVARTMHDKLVSRHPHVFGDADASDAASVVANWEQIKKAEKQRVSIMDGIPVGLPALSLTQKVLEKAQRSGRGVDPAWVEAQLASPATLLDDLALDEGVLGRHLVAVVERARRLGLDAESALRRATGDARARYERAEGGDPDVNWVIG